MLPISNRPLAYPGTIEHFWRSANYLVVVLNYLRANVFLRSALTPADFKERVTGHWGTCPGINAIYAAIRYVPPPAVDQMRLVIGTGHAGPALLACQFLDGTLEERLKLCRSERGFQAIAEHFALQGGFDNELAPEYPGVLLPTGELGSALGFSQGLALGAKDSLVLCVLGDGELETGLTQAAWPAFRLMSSEDGVVLPIINANGWRMGGRSLFSQTSTADRVAFFSAHQLEPLFCGPGLNSLRDALQQALSSYGLYDEEPRSPDRRPVVVYESPKGATGPLRLLGQPFTGTASSHKPPLKKPGTNPAERTAIAEWLESYDPTSLFRDTDATYAQRCFPNDRPICDAALIPDAIDFKLHLTQSVESPSGDSAAAVAAAALTRNVAANDAGRFLITSPDELFSNGFGSLAPYVRGKRGSDDPRAVVLEILNEPLCFAWLLGHVAAGGRGFMISYEAFAPLLDSLATQYLRFVGRARALPWRTSRPSVNLLLTSLGWHNCPTHHNPGFVDALLGRGLSALRVYAPVSHADVAAVIDSIAYEQDRFNVVVFSKHRLPAVETAFRGCALRGWHEFSTGSAPDRALVVIGDCIVEQCLNAVRRAGSGAQFAIIAIAEPTLLERPKDAACASLLARLGAFARYGVFYQGYTKTAKALFWNAPRPCFVQGFDDQASPGSIEERFAANGMSEQAIMARMRELLL